jgi:hypothetical protein
MALGNINVDNRTYEQLLSVLKQHIPTAEWRDHNPSDPGIMLLELLAWLGEMSLYRMNRVPRSHREKFVKLIADPPQPATTLVTFSATLDPALRPVGEPLLLPAGTRLATDFSNGRRYVFETLERLSVALPKNTTSADPLLDVSATVRARELVVVESQKVGTSDGSADQVFGLVPPRDVVETPDHPPQMSVPSGFSPAVVGGGKLGQSVGIVDVAFDEDDLEKAHLLSYDPGAATLTIERLGGPSEAVPVPAGPIAPGTTETIVFPALNGLRVALGAAFDKASSITIEPAIVTVAGTGAAINAATVSIVAARGLPQAQSSTLLTFSRLSTPATAVVAAASGLSGVVDLTSAGTKTVYLDDRWGRGIEIQFDVTTGFDGSETSAVIDLPALSNVFFLGSHEDVRHSPWSEVLMDFVFRCAAYDPNPQVRVASGFSPALAASGKLGPASGVAGVTFGGPSMEEAYLLRYLTGPPRIRLQRPDGSEQTIPVSALPIPAGSTETVSFPAFNVQLALDDRFDKAAPVDVAPATVTIDGGAGTIDAGSVQIVGTRGLVPSLESSTIELSNLSDPEHVAVMAGRGLRGLADLSTAGPKTVRLRDAWQRRLDVELTVTTPFDGTEAAASIDLHALENLFFLGTLWEARRSLRTEASRVVSGTAAPVRHCQIDSFDRALRFGDGVLGSLPPAGADIVASYRVLQGPEALVRKNELEFLLDPPPLFSTEALSFENEDGEGGLRFFAPETRTAEALLDINRTYRLVTAEDFERVLLVDFNEFDAMAQAAPNVLTPDEVRSRRAERPTVRRAVAMMNCDAALETRRGHVAVLVLARPEADVDPDVLHDESLPLATKQSAVDVSQRLQDRILRFLEERRLITTRLSVVSAQLVAVHLTTVVVVDRRRNVTDVYTGYFEGKGWPLGRAVYESEIYQFLEGLDGVDHVASLTLSPADPHHDVILGPSELPVLQKLTLSVDRA